MIVIIVYRRCQVKRIDSFILIALTCKMNSTVHNWYYLHYHSSLEGLQITLTMKKQEEEEEEGTESIWV